MLKQSTCPYCGVGCGVDVQISGTSNKAQPGSLATNLPTLLKGTPEHPANYGRLCVKGSHLLDTLDQSHRLEKPQVDGKDVTWDEACSEVAQRFSRVIQEHGPDSVAFYVSGQLLTEDYYVANKLMKGYIGSANIDTNSRLCMSSAVAAQKRAFGSDTVPCTYEDLELSDLIVLVGSNAAWTHPVLFQRMERAKQINPDLKVVVIDPRKTASCELADLHLPIKAGSDVALFNGLLNYLKANDGIDCSFVENSVNGLSEALTSAEEWSLQRTASVCDLPVTSLETFFEWFCSSASAMSFYSMGINQSSSGVDKANSIINCHLASGKIGKPGSAPFSITGQPNAMGGREVGGLSNLLAAHMDIDKPEHRELVQGYWQSPAMAEKPGLKAVDLFEAIDSGEVKAVWVMATNPLVSMPNRNLIERALEKCECVVVSDYVASNDTLAYADIKLPATGWSEKDGTVTNSARTISRQRAFLPPFEEARHDWKIICDVAKAMGYSGFDYESAHQIFTEYAGLTGYRNNGSRDLDLSGLADLSLAEYEQLKPIQWPVNAANPAGTQRLFTDGRFYTATGKANCIAVRYHEPAQATSEDYPFVLNSGRLRDQWHTMTRTGASPTLSQHNPEPKLAIHPDDAREHDLKEGDFVSLSSVHSIKTSRQFALPLLFDSGVRRGELFAPIHWGKEWASSASLSYLYSSDHDAISGQPELKHAAVALHKCEVEQRGYLLVREPLKKSALSLIADVWSKTRVKEGYLYRISNFEHGESFSQICSRLGVIDSSERMTYETPTGKVTVHLGENRLCGLILEQDAATTVSRSWLEFLLSKDEIDDEELGLLLHGEIASEFAQGRVVCSCFKVGEKAIVDAIDNKGCHSVEALGDELKCGTNCGSCKSELKQMLRARSLKAVSLDGEEALV